MQNSTPKNFKKLMSLLTKTGLQGRRHAIVWQYSGERTESSKDLTTEEIDNIINDLELHFKDLDKANEMRRKMIAIAHDMRWELADGSADIKRINNWCIEKGPYKKLLNSHSIKELGIVLGVFEKVYKDYMKKL